ncbi:DNA gyrase subunit A [Geodia barretti]|uniref:DNA topoisomerase (ATP-hydrolyzing) n=1 Tax=Geodia barretti TaxID=519541 RepID=A0AA35X0U7_GEOBA|nr:DNA gyrase subunit A [Geodia barretti]
MSVNTNRAIPDLRDGLKPSTRRLLYAMGEMNLTAGRSYDKCAAVVGEVMKNFHPHGDGPIYDTLVGLVQDFAMRYPLVDGQGNFGSIDDDPPGAMRYTECRLMRIADEMLADIHKNTVDFQPNYKESTTEPTVLPARLPNLLVNGTTEATLEDLMVHIPGPDFPTAAEIVGRAGIRDIYANGRGSITVRGKAVIERTKEGRERILITEIPYQVKKNHLLQKMYDLVAGKIITGISDIRDESDHNMRVIVELKRGEIAQVILNQLYKHAQMQTNYSAIMLCLVDGLPKVLSLKEIMSYYLVHRREVVRRRTQYDLDVCERRSHILEGYRIALNNIEDVIDIVQTAESPEDARNLLIENYDLSEKINDEYANLIEQIEELRTILGSEILITNIIKEELLELKAKYAGERRTQIVDAATEFNIEDLIADEEMVVAISHEGYIKRVPITTYRRQHRGGVGVIGMQSKEGDYPEQVFIASAHQYILFFTDRGKCYWLKVFEIPERGRTASGQAIVNLLRLENDEKITAFVPVREFDEERFVFMATERGIVKKCSLAVFSRPNSAGIIAIKLDEGDKLIGAQLTEGDHNILLVTRSGGSIRFNEEEVRKLGRATMGVRGIRLEKDDFVVGMVAAVDEGETVLIVTENGYGKRTLLANYRLQGRAGKGVIAIKTSARNGPVVAMKMVADNDELIIVNSNGMLTRMVVNDIRTIGRNTQGVRLMSLRKEEIVVDVGKIPQNGEEVQNDDESETDES